MITIGFYKGHNNTACILKDGEILAAVSEERFNRIKNTDVFPKQAIDYCIQAVGTTAREVDLFVHHFEDPLGSITPTGEEQKTKSLEIALLPVSFLRKLVYKFKFLFPILRRIFSFILTYLLKRHLQWRFRTNVSKFYDIDPKKISFANHHLCHAYSAFYGFVPKIEQDKNFLVITVDAEGDDLCSTVSTVKKGVWRRIAKTHSGDSPAVFYGWITKFLGMKVNEHEYKVMGLAPYASQYEIDQIYDKFDDLFWVDDDLVIHSKVPSGSYLEYFDDVLLHKRFDAIAACAQLTAEKVALSLVQKAIKKTGIKNIVVSGGFFMNIKINQKIAELEEVKIFIPCPTSGDESAVFGAAYLGYENLCKKNSQKFVPQNIINVYLGPRFSDEEISGILKAKKVERLYKVQKFKDIEKKIATLLAEGKIVGRFKNRMEWGARALGNRSILMDSSRVDLKLELNDQVKSRDFWMPFAATILSERQKDYILNPKKINASYMTTGFNTTAKGRLDLAAAIHPYDFTCRPQVLEREDNPEYYKLIKYFEELTGIGAVLNTSFNFHGEPIVCSPKDALHTFGVTGLKYLALGNYLIFKK